MQLWESYQKITVTKKCEESTFRRQLQTSQRSDALNKIQNQLEESTKQEQNTSGRCWLLLYVVFTFCIPEQLKKHLSKQIQVLAGIVFFCFLIIGYVVLYIFYGRAEEQIFLTTVIPDKYVQCNETLISQSGAYILSHDLQWRSAIFDLKYLLKQQNTKNQPGRTFEPWTVNFVQYKANTTKFEEDMSTFIHNINQFVATLDKPGQEMQGYENRQYFNTFNRLLFHNQQINGTEGVAIINFNFQAEIFDNLNLQILGGVYTVNFTTLEDILYPAVPVIAKGVYPYLSNLYSQQTTYWHKFNFTNFYLISWSQSTKKVLQNQFKNLTESDFQKLGNDIVDSIQIAQLYIRFDIIKLFVIDYCQKIGIEKCFNLNQGHNHNNNNYLFSFNDVIDNNLILFMNMWKPSMLDEEKDESSILVKNGKWLVLEGTGLNVNFLQGREVKTQEGNFSTMYFSFFAVPIIYRDLSFNRDRMVVELHFFSDYQVTFLNSSTSYKSNQSTYLGSISYFAQQNYYFEKILKNSRFVKDFYNSNITSPPFTLSSGVYSCKVQNNPSFLERLANTHATGELISIILILLLIIVFMLCILPQLRTRQTSVVEQLSDAIMTLFQQVTEAA